MHTTHHTHNASSSMGHGSARDFLRRFWIVTALLIPLTLTHEGVAGVLGISTIASAHWIGFGIATIIFGFSLIFFVHAWHEIRARSYGMMTLVSLAVASGYLFSVASTFMPSLEVSFYLEISTLIWVLLFGHYLEARSSSVAGDALSEVAKLLPKEAHLLADDGERDIAVDELAEGDRVRVKPGEKVPADGRIESGSAYVNESHITGESHPVRKQEGDEVSAGAITVDGSLTIILTRVGEHSTIGQIQTLIANAQTTKPRQARIADTAAGVLTFVALGGAIATVLVWSLLLGESFVFSMTLAITVLVIACPHALGLAIPAVTTITTTLAAKNGIFIKDLSKIETIKRADTVVFDKTGTLTAGEFGVQSITTFGGGDADEVLSVAASLERHSSHIIGQAIVAYAREKKVALTEPTDFQNIAGKGVAGLIGDKAYTIGNRALMQERAISLEGVHRDLAVFEEKGGTVVIVARDGSALGAISLTDRVREESHKAVAALHTLGVHVVMLTGDNERVARGVASELAINTFIANVLPEEKYTHIKKLQDDGRVVLMVGDGVNDAPALTQADAGIAIGAGTDVAVEAGDIVLTRNNPLDVVRLITLSRAVYHKMVQNLVWALGYNVVALPAAAGVFAAWGFFLRPEIGALIMSLSTVIVVVNAMMLKRIVL